MRRSAAGQATAPRPLSNQAPGRPARERRHAAREPSSRIGVKQAQRPDTAAATRLPFAQGQVRTLLGDLQVPIANDGRHGAGHGVWRVLGAGLAGEGVEGLAGEVAAGDGFEQVVHGAGVEPFGGGAGFAADG